MSFGSRSARRPRSLKRRRKATVRPRSSTVLRKESQHTSVVTRPVDVTAWVILVMSAMLTLIAFMTLDPNPSPLLACCSALNVAIMLWAIYRLYQLDLLLSPMMLVYLGPAMILSYSWGNLGARIAGDSRFAAILGTLDYYPTVAMLSTIGLLLYCWIVFGVFKEYFCRVAIKYQDLYWHPRQVLAAIFLGIFILLYLSAKYSFTNGYFRDVENHFDRWLIATVDAFVYLLVIISVSVAAHSAKHRDRLIGFTGIILSVILALGLRSRTFMVMILLLTVLCWLTIKPKQVRLSYFVGIGLAGLLVFSLGTVVKSVQGTTSSIVDNLYALSSTAPSQMLASTSEGIGIDRQYRTGGFEYPAAILRCLDGGAPPAYGIGLWGAALQGLPGFLRPVGVINERGNISLHYAMYCYSQTDEAMAIPLVSGIGDWGIPGVLIYILLGVFSLLLWRVAQLSPRFFMAYLLVPVYPDSLFWSGIFTYVKTMAFLWIVLWVLWRFLKPDWIPSGDDAAKPVPAENQDFQVRGSLEIQR
jgi:hypothetical protein